MAGEARLYTKPGADDMFALKTLVESGRLSETSLDATFVARRVHVIGLWGQSNMSGRGADYSTFLDPENDRIKQYGSGASSITPASEPLDMHDTPTGIGPGLQFARQYLTTLPQDDVILLVPSAHGGTPLVSNDTLAWRWGVTGNLSDQASEQIEDAMTAAATEWPNATITLDAILWFQGETDSNTTNLTSGADYRDDLDALIAGVRTRFSISDLPFVIGQMIPESLGTGTRDAINYEHTAAPHRVAHVGLAESEPGYSNGDLVHSNADGHRLIYGPRMHAEFQRIRAGIAPTTDVAQQVIVADDFNRANGSLDGSTPSIDLTGASATWSVILDAGTVTIASNAAVFAAPSAATQIATVDATVADAIVSATFTRTLGTGHIRLLGRWQSATNYWMVQWRSSVNAYQLYRVVSGTTTQIGSNLAPTPASGDRVALRMEGTAITVLINDAVAATTTDSAHVSETRWGIGHVYQGTSSTLTAEDFEVAAL